ncbi:MAG: hypothetical protein U0800_12065 [Isosphaeraceae bacterium]
MDPNLNDIPTCWSDIRMAHEGPPELARAAMQALLARYDRAIRRYLLGALRDPDAAEEVYQIFAYRLLNGAFRHADPARGRFRDLLRTALSRMVTDFYRERDRALPADFSARSVADPRGPELDDEKRFLEIWLWDLMGRAWEHLAEAEARTRQPLHSVLRIRVERPELDSAGLARALRDRSGLEYGLPQVRKLLYNARKQFIAEFVGEVEQTLVNPTYDEIEGELQALGMLNRCRDHLRDRRDRARPGSSSNASDGDRPLAAGR